MNVERLSRILLMVAVVVTLVVAATYIVHPVPVKAAGGSLCFAPCYAPPSTPTCAGGGTAPFTGTTEHTIVASTGGRAILYIPAVTGCQVYLSSMNGNVAGSTTTYQSSAFGAWTSNDSTCNTGNFLATVWNVYMAVSANHPTQETVAPLGTDVIAASNTGVCVGFYNSSSNMAQSSNVFYGYQ